MGATLPRLIPVSRTPGACDPRGRQHECWVYFKIVQPRCGELYEQGGGVHPEQASPCVRGCCCALRSVNRAAWEQPVGRRGRSGGGVGPGDPLLGPKGKTTFPGTLNAHSYNVIPF